MVLNIYICHTSYHLKTSATRFFVFFKRSEHNGKQQLVQNAASRVLTGTPRRAHVQPVLKQLPWLPVAARIRFKVWVMTFKAIRSGPCIPEGLPTSLFP